MLLWELARAADDLINTDLDDAHVNYLRNDNGLVLSRSFEHNVETDSALYTKTCREHLDVTRHDSSVTGLRTYKIAEDWSVASRSMRRKYTMICEGDTISATASDQGGNGEHDITEYDVRQLTNVFAYYCQIASVDPPHSPAS